MTKFLRATLLATAVLLANDARAATVLITGTNRGIGLEMVKQYADKGWTVIATARKPSDAKDLNEVAATYKKTVSVETLDVANPDSIKALATKLKGKPIDLLINNAGTLGDLPPQTVGTFQKDTFETVLLTNVYGPLAVSEALRENVAASQGKKIVALTSGLGSATLTQRRGGMYAYRASKGALNVSMRALAADLKPQGIVVGIVAPGMVETDLLAASGYKGPALKVGESVAGLMKVIDGVSFENNDKAVNYNGEVIPW